MPYLRETAKSWRCRKLPWIFAEQAYAISKLGFEEFVRSEALVGFGKTAYEDDPFAIKAEMWAGGGQKRVDKIVALLGSVIRAQHKAASAA